MFTKEDLKPGYVIKWRCGIFLMILPTENDGLIMVTTGHWNRVSDLKKDLTDRCPYTQCDVMEVYGYAEYGQDSILVSPKNRPLLWKREEPQPIDVTMAEVIEKFGHPVRIVKEKEYTVRKKKTSDQLWEEAEKTHKAAMVCLFICIVLELAVLVLLTLNATGITNFH